MGLSFGPCSIGTSLIKYHRRLPQYYVTSQYVRNTRFQYSDPQIHSHSCRICLCRILMYSYPCDMRYIVSTRQEVLQEITKTYFQMLPCHMDWHWLHAGILERATAFVNHGLQPYCELHAVWNFHDSTRKITTESSRYTFEILSFLK